MLVVETIAKIRRAYFAQNKPIKTICRELRLSRKVVRKVIRSRATEFRYERGRLPRIRIFEELRALGAGFWTDEQSRRNFEKKLPRPPLFARRQRFHFRTHAERLSHFWRVIKSARPRFGAYPGILPELAHRPTSRYEPPRVPDLRPTGSSRRDRTDNSWR